MTIEKEQKNSGRLNWRSKVEAAEGGGAGLRAVSSQGKGSAPAGGEASEGGPITHMGSGSAAETPGFPLS